VWSEAGNNPFATGGFAFPADRLVVSQGVRHVAVDDLPWDHLTFRTVCGHDVVEDEHPSPAPTDCEWCRRFERAWLLVKAIELI